MTSTKIKGVSVTASQAAVYSVLKEHGPLPDHALVPIVQHVAQSHQSSSGIRTRRLELVGKGLAVATLDRVTMPSGRRARVFKAVR